MPPSISAFFGEGEALAHWPCGNEAVCFGSVVQCCYLLEKEDSLPIL